jgi:predicted permease
MMSRIHQSLARLAALFKRRRMDGDLEEDLATHLELLIDEYVARGMGRDAARREARLRFGSMVSAVETQRDVRSFRALEDLAQDLRFGLRGMRRNPIFATVIVLSLALGIGANTALFGLIEATLVRELPVDAPEELVFLQWHAQRWSPDFERFAGSASIGRFYRSPTFSNAAFDALQAQNRTLSDVFAFNTASGVTATIGGQGDAATMQLVSGNYFSGLGVRPAIGRGLMPSDDKASADPAAVISSRFFERRFGRDPSAIGARVVLEGAPFTIVGVAPEPFRGAVALAARRPDFWIPLAFAPRFGPRYTERGFWWLSVMGRLRPDATRDQVRGNLEGAFRAAVLTTESLPSDGVLELHVLSARRGAIDEGPEDELEHAVILGGVFGVLLLIVCLNVANLVLARAPARRTEIGVRLALGAGRERLIRQLLTESVTLSIAGGTLGIGLAYWGRAAFGASGWVPPDLDIRLSPGVLGLTALLSAAVGILFGLAPAFRATRIRWGGTVERLEIRAASRSRAGATLLVTQVATAVVLLVGAGLFMRTLWSWDRLETGFDPHNLLVFQINLDALGYDPARAGALRDQLVTRIRTVPGVVGSTTSGPFWRATWFGGLVIDGEARRLGRHMGGAPNPHWLAVRHDFFETIGLPLEAGRGFRAEEDQQSPNVAVVDANFAREFFGGASPIGHRIMFQAGGHDVEIVGIVGNMWMPGTRPEDVAPAIYLPERTRRTNFDPKGASRRATYRITDASSVEIRTASDPMTILPAIRAAVSEIDPNVAVEDPKTVVQGIREILTPTRIVSLIWLSFGGVAVALTAIGLYGLLAASVTQRTREIGIRTALGARRLDIVRLVTGQTLGLVSLGIAVGLTVSMVVNQLARAYIFGVTFYDPVTLAAVALVLAAVTGVAAMLPTLKALGVDPAVALRWE